MKIGNFGNRFNYDDVFLRDLTACVLDTMENKIKWINRFSTGDIHVVVPFYYSMSGDERFLFDTFTDDVLANNRYTDVNTDIIPRAHLTLTSWSPKGDEFANPNVWLRTIVENEVEMRKEMRRVRGLPILAKYDMTVLVNTEIDAFKCSQSIMNLLWMYKYMYFEYNFMHIDAFLQVPDDQTVEITREKDLSTDNTIKVSVSFDVHTYYPATITEGKEDGIIQTLDPASVNPKRVSWLDRLRADAVSVEVTGTQSTPKRPGYDQL